jgi:hypothetical protein
VISSTLANAIIVIVTAVWVTSFLVALFTVTYKPDPQINVIFMAIVGGAMALKARKPAGSHEEKKS